MKPGYKTTEFWASVLTGAILLVSAIADYLPPRYAAIAGGIVALGYNVSRGLAKVPTPIVPAVHVSDPPRG